MLCVVFHSYLQLRCEMSLDFVAAAVVSDQVHENVQKNGMEYVVVAVDVFAENVHAHVQKNWMTIVFVFQLDEYQLEQIQVSIASADSVVDLVVFHIAAVVVVEE